MAERLRFAEDQLARGAPNAWQFGGGQTRIICISSDLICQIKSELIQAPEARLHRKDIFPA